MGIDNENADEYRLEREEITKRQILRSALQDVDRSKVYVNTGGILQSLS